MGHNTDPHRITLSLHWTLYTELQGNIKEIFSPALKCQIDYLFFTAFTYNKLKPSFEQRTIVYFLLL